MLIEGHNIRDLTGFRSSKLVAVSVSGYQPRGRTRWVCECDCGKIKDFDAAELTRSKRAAQSCGCIRIKHGLLHTPEYSAWRAMIYRCHTSTSPKFKDYGARGISVCERWRSSFKTFLADIGQRPSAGYSLDRINNNGNYEPDNCRWATPQQQNNNRRGVKNVIGI